MIAPAASSVPSMPSVSPASAQMPLTSCKVTASDNRNSVLRPPLPALPFSMVTVVSPPDSKTAGPWRGNPLALTESEMPPSNFPASRASPSSASPKINVARPYDFATFSAAVKRHRRRSNHTNIWIRRNRRFILSRRKHRLGRNW